MTPDLQRRDPRAVRKLFTRVAPRYRFMNTLMTGSQDGHWRAEAVRKAQIPAQGRVLDLGAGTGDLAREVLRQGAGRSVIAVDFTRAMMAAGRASMPAEIRWAQGDGLHLPFAADFFDAVVSAFLLRNVNDVQQLLRESWRVLRPGGHWVALETTPLQAGWMAPLASFHERRVIPWLGKMITGREEDYRYLAETSAHFLSTEALANLLRQAGFGQVGFERLTFGAVAIHWGIKVP
jgi:demethylmenaquinone methyltransferase/2-methoxy-6-polyprenyl-1,4-benzoquinol methylase